MNHVGGWRTRIGALVLAVAVAAGAAPAAAETAAMQDHVKRSRTKKGRKARAQRRARVPRRVLAKVLRAFKKLARQSWKKALAKRGASWKKVHGTAKKLWSKGLSWLKKLAGREKTKPRKVVQAPPAEAPSAPSAPPTVQPTPPLADKGVIFPFEGYRQCVGPWRDVLLGSGPKTICGAGCALTSMAMLLQFYGKKLTPTELNDVMKANGWFTSGYVIGHWPSDLVGKTTRDSWPWDERDSDADWEQHWQQRSSEALRLVHENFAGSSPKPMIGQVDYLDDSNHKGDHFVLIAGVDASGEPLVYDPGSSTSDPMPVALGAAKRRSGMLLLRVLWLE